MTELGAREILEPGVPRSAALDLLTADLRRITGLCSDRARPQAVRILDRAIAAAIAADHALERKDPPA